MARCEVGWLLRHSVVLSVEVWSFGRAAGWYMYLGCTVLQSVVGSVIRLYLRLVARSFVRSYKESAITRGIVSLGIVNMLTLFIRHTRSSEILLIKGR